MFPPGPSLMPPSAVPSDPFGPGLPPGPGSDDDGGDEPSPLLAALAAQLSQGTGQGGQPDLEALLNLLAMQGQGDPTMGQPMQGPPGITQGIPPGGAGMPC